jgi:hypothetical protein
MLGHSSIVTTADTYTSVLPETAHRAAQATADMIMKAAKTIPRTRLGGAAVPTSRPLSGCQIRTQGDGGGLGGRAVAGPAELQVQGGAGVPQPQLVRAGRVPARPLISHGPMGLKPETTSPARTAAPGGPAEPSVSIGHDPPLRPRHKARPSRPSCVARSAESPGSGDDLSPAWWQYRRAVRQPELRRLPGNCGWPCAHDSGDADTIDRRGSHP